jgi:hypothetical protein
MNARPSTAESIIKALFRIPDNTKLRTLNISSTCVPHPPNADKFDPMGCTSSTTALRPHVHEKATKGKKDNSSAAAAVLPVDADAELGDGLPVESHASTAVLSSPTNSMSSAAEPTRRPSMQSRLSESHLRVAQQQENNASGPFFRTMSGHVTSVSRPALVPVSGDLLATCLATPHSVSIGGSGTRASELYGADLFAPKRRSTIILAAGRSAHTRSFAQKLGIMQDQGKDWNDIPL